jgi:cytochrome b involved in lipid metabolism
MIKSALMAIALTSDLKPRKTSAVNTTLPHPSTKYKVSSPATATPEAAGVRQISTAELNLANQADRGWVAIRGQVYDLTSFMRKHPGGFNIILAAVGRDCTLVFETSHTDSTAKILA